MTTEIRTVLDKIEEQVKSSVDQNSIRLQLDFISKRIDTLEDHMTERFTIAKERVATALDATEKAISKAEVATDKRFDSVNEFRLSLSDQTKLFVQQTEYSTGHRNLVEKIENLSNQVTVIDTTVRSKLSTMLSGPSLMLGLASVITITIISIVTGAIQLGSLQTHVTINTDIIQKLLTREDLQDRETERQNIIAGNVATQHQFFEKRLDKIENSITNLVEDINKHYLEDKKAYLELEKTKK